MLAWGTRALGSVPQHHINQGGAHTCNSHTGEEEAGRAGLKGHPWLHSKFETSLGYRRLFGKEGERERGKEGGREQKGKCRECRWAQPCKMPPPWSLTETGRSWVTALAMPPVGNTALD